MPKKPSPVEAASIIVLKGDAVCLVHRADGPFAGLWSLPGGRLEPGEDAAVAARRELLEETGLSVGDVQKLGRFDPLGDGAIALTVFAARAQDGEPHAADDAAEAAFVRFQRLGDRQLTPGARRWIARAITALCEAPLP